MFSILVLLSTYNGKKYLSQQLNSILHQTGVKVSILIRDDGSSDNTLDILYDFQKRNSNIEIIKGHNVGYALSFTKLAIEANKRKERYDFFAFSDQDDVWLPTKLAVAVELLENESNQIPIAYFSNTTLVDENLNFIKDGFSITQKDLTKPHSLLQNYATGCTMVFNHKALEIYVDNQPKFIQFHDYLLYQICIFLGKVIYDKNSYILYRQHSSNQIGVPTFFKRMRQRLKTNRNKNHCLNRNRAFYEAYYLQLKEEDMRLFEVLLNYKKSIKNKFRLLFNKEISFANSLESNVFLKLKIILGWL